MKFRNEKYEAVKIKWDGIDLPLRAGTPIDIGGNIANNANAIGIVMQTVTVRPVVDTLYIMMSGDVDLKDLEKEAGITLSDEAKTAMSGINFWMDNARIYQPAPSEGGGGGGIVIANPEGEATDDLEKIQIGDEIYGISGGGGDILVVNAVHDDVEDRLELDKTYNEIVASINSKIPVYIYWSISWEEDDVTHEVHQLYPVHVCKVDTATGEYRVYIIGFSGGTDEVYFYSSTRDGVLVYGD